MSRSSPNSSVLSLTLLGVMLGTSGCSLALTNDFRFPGEEADAGSLDANMTQADMGVLDAGRDSSADAQETPDAGRDAGPLPDGGPLPECVRTMDCDLVASATVSCVDGMCVPTCNPGYADCDSDLVRNGCEVDLNSDAAHCGACGTNCAAANTSASCVAGLCERTCDATFANCNGTPDCETRLGTGLDCNACGDACGVGNFCDTTSGVATCALECLSPRTICDSACVDLATSLAHCGACGSACAPANASGTCAASVCSVTSCDAGFADCSAADGCETPLRTLTDCTGCGVGCALAHAAESCGTGSCEVTSCEPGYSDCNGSDADGCEVDLMRDEQSCGTCGNICAAGAECIAGLCDPVIDVAPGNEHTCALRRSGQVWCWGGNSYGELADGTTTTRVAPAPAAGAFRFDQLTSGFGFTCGIERVTQRVMCWGRNGYGELGDNTGANRVQPVPIAALPRDAAAFVGRRFLEVRAMASGACARDTTGEVWCWGRNDSGSVGIDPMLSAVPPAMSLRYVYGAVRVVGATAVEQLSAGVGHVCARSGDRVSCWGDNFFGQLGDGGTTSRFAPAPVALTGITHLDTSPFASCAIATAGAVFCWGRNDEGDLGIAGVHRLPTANGVVADRLQCGANFCLARSATGWVGWGARSYGQHGDGTEGAARALPTALTLDAAMDVRTGATGSVCGILGGRLFCWGADLSGQLGTRTLTVQPPLPVSNGVVPLGSIDQLATGGSSTCIIAAGEVRCAGENGTGILARGGGFPGATAIPLTIAGLQAMPGIPTPARSLAVGRNFACAITGLDGARSVWCWGSTLGISSLVTPMRAMTSGGEPIALAAGYAHVCAIVLQPGGERVAQCWGSNGAGELGRGTVSAWEMTPVTVAGITDVEELELGEGYSCARQTSGGVKCWGANSTGQLGTGDLLSSSIPLPVVGITNATDLGVGAGHACVVRTGGAVSCWGRNADFSQLGIGSAGNQSSPVTPMGLPAGITAVAAGGRHTCVLAAGRPYCWGNNSDGELGSGTRVALPGVRMLPTTDAISITVARNSIQSSSHTCVRHTDNTATCWGLATSGRCASGERLWLTTPTASLLSY